MEVVVAEEGDCSLRGGLGGMDLPVTAVAATPDGGVGKGAHLPWALMMDVQAEVRGG